MSRHTTAVHLLEAGVEVNVVRGWLGYVDLDTSNFGTYPLEAAGAIVASAGADYSPETQIRPILRPHRSSTN